MDLMGGGVVLDGVMANVCKVVHLSNLSRTNNFSYCHTPLPLPLEKTRPHKFCTRASHTPCTAHTLYSLPM